VDALVGVLDSGVQSSGGSTPVRVQSFQFSTEFLVGVAAAAVGAAIVTVNAV